MTKRLKGLFKDTDPVDQPEGTYLHAQNIVIEEELGAIVNEAGTTLEDSGIPANNKVIGTQLLGDGSVVLFSVNDDATNCEIGLFKEGSYTILLNSTNLGFFKDYKIQSDTLINRYGEQIVVWTDGLNPPRWLNIDDPISVIDYTSIFPHTSDAPVVKVKSINVGSGSLSDGVYYFAVSYLDNDSDDVLTNFYNVTGPVSVRPAHENKGSSSITIDLDGIDTHYDRIQIAVIRKIDNIIDEVHLLPELASDISEYTYTGREGVRPGALEEIQIDKAFYPRVQTLHLNDDILYMGNMEEGKDIDYQPYANNIKVHLAEEDPPDIILDKNGNWKSGNPITNQYYKGYFKGETYAFYITWLLKDGGETKAYHIPGRELIAEDIETVESEGTEADLFTSSINTPSAANTFLTIDYLDQSTTINMDSGDTLDTVGSKTATELTNNSNFPMTASFDTDENVLTVTHNDKSADPNGNQLFFSIDESDWNGDPFNNMAPVFTGGTDPTEASDEEFKFQYESIYDSTYHMGGWENQDELYPSSNDWVVKDSTGEIIGDLRGEKVRHHNIPDIDHLEVPYKYSRPVGIKLTDVTLPEGFEEDVIGYKIYYAKHDEGNRKILDQAILCNSLVDENEDLNDENYYTNSPFNDPPHPVAGTEYSVDTRTHYSYPFTLLRKRTNIEEITHVQIIGQTDTSTKPYADVSPPWEGSTSHVHQMLDTNHFISFPNGYSGDRDIKLTAKAYVNASADRNLVNLQNYGFPYNMNNYSGVSTLVLRTESDLDKEQYYLANIRILRRNLYSPFDQQQLVDTGYIHTDLENTNSEAIYGGDSFVQQLYAFKANRTPKDHTQVGVHRSILYQSYDNINLRKFGEESWESYYPRVDAVQLSAMYYSEDGTPLYTDVTREDYAFKETDNYFGYDEGESSVNDIKFPEIHKKNPDRIKNHPTRIIRSQDNFRVFLQNDFMDLSKKRGKLVKLTTYNNVLIPHMERALVRTKGREELRTDEITAFVGSGDIFSVKPEEIIYTKDGFGGIVDKKHSLSTPFGYFFYDALTNRFYKLDDNGLRDITEGIRSEIRDLDIEPSVISSPSDFDIELI